MHFVDIILKNFLFLRLQIATRLQAYSLNSPEFNPNSNPNLTLAIVLQYKTLS